MLPALSDVIGELIAEDYREETGGLYLVEPESTVSEDFRRDFQRISRTSLGAYWVQDRNGKKHLIVNGIAEDDIEVETRERQQYWTEAEDFLLKMLYPTKGAPTVAKEIKDRIGYTRSTEAVRQRALILKVKSNGKWWKKDKGGEYGKVRISPRHGCSNQPGI